MKRLHFMASLDDSKINEGRELLRQSIILICCILVHCNSSYINEDVVNKWFEINYIMHHSIF